MKYQFLGKALWSKNFGGEFVILRRFRVASLLMTPDLEIQKIDDLRRRLWGKYYCGLSFGTGSPSKVLSLVQKPIHSHLKTSNAILASFFPLHFNIFDWSPCKVLMRLPAFLYASKNAAPRPSKLSKQIWLGSCLQADLWCRWHTGRLMLLVEWLINRIRVPRVLNERSQTQISSLTNKVFALSWNVEFCSGYWFRWKGLW